MKQILKFFIWCYAVIFCSPGIVHAQQPAAVPEVKLRFLKPKSHDEEDIRIERDSIRVLRLMIAGNVYQTERHINYCFDEAAGRYNFRDVLKYIQPILGLGDVTIANLKTSFGGDERNMHSAPDEFALALKYSGINVLMHANMHAAHIDKSTLSRTRELIYDLGMYHTGAYVDNMQRLGNFPLIINKKGFRIAILNYAILQNRPSISRNFIINEADKLYIERDLRMARISNPDFTIVYFDWGNNLQNIPSASQIELAQYCFQQGADMVVGTHPNAPMRIDYIPYYKNGSITDGIVAYSLGNLIASNDEIYNRNGYVLDIELVKNNFTNETRLGEWGVIPVYTHYDTVIAKGKMKFFSVPCSSVESGEILPDMPYIEKRRAVNSAYNIRQLMGAAADEIQYNLNENIANNVMETIDLTHAALNNRYSQKREKDVPRGNPPVLPVATVGSNNPPSLAAIYGSDAPGAVTGTPSATTATQSSTSGANSPSAGVPVSSVNSTAVTSSVHVNSSVSMAHVEGPYSSSSGSTVSSKATEDTHTVKHFSPAGDRAANVAQDAQNTVAENLRRIYPGEGYTSEAGANKHSSENSVAGAPVPVSHSQLADNTQNRSSRYDYRSTATSDNTSKYSTSVQDTRNPQSANRPDNSSHVHAENTRTHQNTNEGQSATRNVTHENKPNSGTGINKVNSATTDPADRAEKININKATPDVLVNDKPLSVDPGIKKINELNVKLVVDTFYRIQFYALQRMIPLDTNYYTHLKGYEVIEEDGKFKYLLGKYRSYEECERYWKSQILPRYKGSFIVKYVDGKRITEK
ncbi:MAG: CapA family protein [Chitinophagales bacterium]|nr:CapA family protein [Chitinophagales bacterium]MDW8418108.1 CapA family protein [Chitinophagales bacterium]